jgi:D-sedoheptulose 7-phosphate isomerase
MTTPQKKRSNKYFQRYFQIIESSTRDVDESALINFTKLAERRNSKIIIAGNGGSAAMASHVAVDFTKAAGIRAINFNEADLITCFANDYGYENWVAKAIEAYGDPGDLVILISSSGRSPNIINAASYAKQNSFPLVTLSGFDSDNPLRKMGDINLWVDSKSYNIVEMTHHIWLLSVVDYIISEANT